jgi:hypothetical protein
MALKNSTGQKVTTRELTKACDETRMTAIKIDNKIQFKGIVDNKISADINIELIVDGQLVVLVGSPLISLNHFELRLKEG